MEHISILNYKSTGRLEQNLEIHDLPEMYLSLESVITTLHRTDFYCIIWFEDGNSKHLVDFQKIDIEPESLLFIRPGVIHQFDTEKHQSGKVIIFKESFFSKTESDADYLKKNILFNDLRSYSKIQLDKKKSTFSNLIILISDELKSEMSSYRTDILRHLLSSLLIFSERKKNEQKTEIGHTKSEYNYIWQFQNNLDRYFKDERNVKFYTEKLQVSEKKLSSITTKILGLSPKQIILDRISLEAKRQLLYSDNNIKEISYDLGFGEPTNFIKFFKKHNKVTPMQFRVTYTTAQNYPI